MPANSYGSAVAVSDGWSIEPANGRRLVRGDDGGTRWVVDADPRTTAVFPSAVEALAAAESAPYDAPWTSGQALLWVVPPSRDGWAPPPQAVTYLGPDQNVAGRHCITDASGRWQTVAALHLRAPGEGEGLPATPAPARIITPSRSLFPGDTGSGPTATRKREDR